VDHLTIDTVRQDRSIELIASENGEQLGRIFVVSPIHLEGPEVEEKWRGSWVFKRLVDAAEKEARALGVKEILAFGANHTMENYISRLGYEQMPLTVWKKVLKCQ
jgi:predicted N-acetyltransferase YhbS